MSATDRIRQAVRDGRVVHDEDGVEALCDLADAARRVPDDGATHGDDGNHKAFPTCARCGLEWPCPTSAIRDALARLDGEGT